jgi:hypothetical protein
MEAPPPAKVMSNSVHYAKTTLVGVTYLVLASVIFSVITSYFPEMSDAAAADADTVDLLMQVGVQLLLIVLVSVVMQRMVPYMLATVSRVLGVNVFVASEAEVAMFLLMAVMFNSGSLKGKIDELGRRLVGAVGL